MHSSTDTTARIVIVDDDPNVLEALDIGLDGSGGIKIAGRYLDCRSALLSVATSPVDVVFLDVRMPDLSGPQCAARLKSVQPQIRVVMMSGSGDSRHILQSFIAGADGYVQKPLVIEECIQAIQDVQQGGVAMNSKVARYLVTVLQSSNLCVSGAADFTRREREILVCLFRGMSDKEIAAELCIAPSTVHSHMHQLFKKLGVNTRAEAVQAFLRL